MSGRSVGAFYSRVSVIEFLRGAGAVTPTCSPPVAGGANALKPSVSCYLLENWSPVFHVGRPERQPPARVNFETEKLICLKAATIALRGGFGECFDWSWDFVGIRD